MALVRMACIALFTIGVFGAGQQSVSTPAVSSPQTYSIAGVVVNSVTGQPVAAASVAIGPTANQNGEVSKAVVTGADGRFAFAGLARGKYSLMATARGFGLQAFDHHDAYASAIAVGPDLDSEHLVFRLEPDSSIEGQVIDDNNDPVQHAMVRLFEKRIQDGQWKTSPAARRRRTTRATSASVTLRRERITLPSQPARGTHRTIAQHGERNRTIRRRRLGPR